MATRIVNFPKVEDSALEIIQATDIPDVITVGVTPGSPLSSL